MIGRPHIQALYAYVIVNAEGHEIVPTIIVDEYDDLDGPVIVPLIGADRAQVAALQRHLFESPQLAGATVRLVRYDRATTLEELRVPTALGGNQTTPTEEE